VLDLSFNDFKGPGFEPLENCKALQQLYLAGNQITSLASLPQLPNLEFLSVAQNKLKSLSMASQPRLQVLAASKNKISTLRGFPYLPVLEVRTLNYYIFWSGPYSECLTRCATHFH
ncbi:187-kDa microtubule-associated protein AIR9-like, partial [Carica papaya]|uniref:187-kDa microtubule-associated protein AIR9-like n=1 Tax=Carica papaya TaxID=3649 RepID=UPI000B8C7469